MIVVVYHDQLCSGKTGSVPKIESGPNSTCKAQTVWGHCTRGMFQNFINLNHLCCIFKQKRLLLQCTCNKILFLCIFKCTSSCVDRWVWGDSLSEYFWISYNLRSFLVHLQTKRLLSNVHVLWSFLFVSDGYKCVQATLNWEDFRLTSGSRSPFPVEASG